MKTALIVAAVALLPAFQDAPAAAPDFAADLKALRTEYQKAQQEYAKQYRAAKTAEERKQLKPPDKDFLPRYQELADKAKGTETGAEALIEVMQLAQRSSMRHEGRTALETLVSDYVKSPHMERLANSLRYAGYQIGDDAVRPALEAIQAKSPHLKARGAAVFILAVQDMNKNPDEARTAFIRLQKEFSETPYAARADAFLFEIDNLGIGKTAPDFEATDEKGAKFKLSDYRGKVTVVDFWGFW